MPGDANCVSNILGDKKTDARLPFAHVYPVLSTSINELVELSYGQTDRHTE